MAKSKKRASQEINASSMADIAFLLLIFFLVTTTIKIDKGILHKLPPWIDQPQDIPPINQRNVLEILVNSNDRLLVENDDVRIDKLKETTKQFIDNNGRNPELSDNPQKAVVSLKNDRGTSYDMYINVQNELKAAYNELRNEKALNDFGMPYNTLPKDKKKKIKKYYPMKISEAEPENFAN